MISFHSLSVTWKTRTGTCMQRHLIGSQVVYALQYVDFSLINVTSVKLSSDLVESDMYLVWPICPYRPHGRPCPTWRDEHDYHDNAHSYSPASRRHMTNIKSAWPSYQAVNPAINLFHAHHHRVRILLVRLEPDRVSPRTMWLKIFGRISAQDKVAVRSICQVVLSGRHTVDVVAVEALCEHRKCEIW